jgi:hypothetical protein
MRESYNKLNKFYTGANRRNETIIGSIEEQLGEGEVGVLVIGGYHEEGIKASLRGRGISYEVITPGLAGDYDESNYLRRVKDQYELFVGKSAVKINDEPRRDMLMVMSAFCVVRNTSEELKVWEQNVLQCIGNACFYKLYINKGISEKQISDFVRYVSNTLKLNKFLE